MVFLLDKKFWRKIQSKSRWDFDGRRELLGGERMRIPKQVNKNAVFGTGIVTQILENCKPPDFLLSANTNVYTTAYKFVI